MEIPKAYEPQSVEDKWYDFWLKQGCFTADPARVTDKRPAYSIVIPPPNVTGMLHMGHVLNNTIQDILSRKARMDGKEVLWLPGTDHAGIATQVQVEKALKKEERKTKYDLGREEFLKRVWAWKEKHGGIIINQLKKLGCSCDWTRERFTMDPEYSRCVQKVFVELYKKGLIYRGKRMVNWCPATQTALSDEEVEMKPQKGFMYHFKVQVAESLPGSSRGHEAPAKEVPSSKFQVPNNQNLLTSAATEEKKGGPEIDAEGRIWLTIATTRPETIPGDTAAAVNPKDPRYAQLIGRHIIRPLPIQLPHEQKLIPIIGDEHVDFEFGTGVLKVTPAHDKADFEIGQRHKLPIADIMNPNGTMNDLAGESLAGLDRFEARAIAVERLKELGVLVEEKPYENNVGFSQRADVPIEPRLSEQWFLKYPAVEQSKACVAKDDEVGLAVPSEPRRAAECAPHQKMHFHPQRWAKTYDHWLANIQDWCISRQLWWGHRIPVWKEGNKPTVADLDFDVESYLNKLTSEDPNGIAYRRHPTGEAVQTASRFIRYVGIAPGREHVVRKLEELGFTQDPDVLDTWFSSWLWPFATMGWTGDKSQDSKTPTLQAFYPTTDLVTGPDIIFFWVARMIMAGYEFMGDLPFQNVYFTGIIRDKQGRKMSKQLGNSPNPLDLIANYGADAMRFGVMRSAPLGQDVLFDEKDVELGRNFCNKLWNACRFRQMVGGGDASSPAGQTCDVGVAATSETEGEINPALLTSDDKWILLRLDQAIREVSDALASYNFSAAVQSLYRFFWSEYCDWYVEASKAVLSGSSRGNEAPLKTIPSSKFPVPSDQSLLTSVPTNLEALRANKLAVVDFVLGHTLRLFHPFLPFITEELWQVMGFNTDLPDDRGGKSIMFATWPKPFTPEEKEYFSLDDAADAVAVAKYELVTLGRALRRDARIDSGKRVKFVLRPAGELAAAEVEVICILLNAEAVELAGRDWKPDKGTPSAANSLGELFLPLAGLVDFAAERVRLTKESEKISAEMEKVQAKLANPNFARKVPPAVLQEHQQRLADWQAKLAQVRNSLDALGF